MNYNISNQYVYEGKKDYIRLLDFISTPVRGALGGRTINVETLEENSPNIITRVFYLFVSTIIFPIGLTGSIALGIKSLLNENPPFKRIEQKIIVIETEEEKTEIETEKEKTVLEEKREGVKVENKLKQESTKKSDEKIQKKLKETCTKAISEKNKFLECLAKDDLESAKLILSTYDYLGKASLINLLAMKQIEKKDLEGAIKTIQTEIPSNLNLLNGYPELAEPMLAIGFELIRREQTKRAVELSDSLMLTEEDRYLLLLTWLKKRMPTKIGQEIIKQAMPSEIPKSVEKKYNLENDYGAVKQNKLEFYRKNWVSEQQSGFHRRYEEWRVQQIFNGAQGLEVQESFFHDIL